MRGIAKPTILKALREKIKPFQDLVETDDTNSYNVM